MTDDHPTKITRIGSGKRNRFEVRLVIGFVLVVLILGSLYVFIFGSPSKDRAFVDSGAANIPHLTRNTSSPSH